VYLSDCRCLRFICPHRQLSQSTSGCKLAKTCVTDIDLPLSPTPGWAPGLQQRPQAWQPAPAQRVTHTKQWVQMLLLLVTSRLLGHTTAELLVGGHPFEELALMLVESGRTWKRWQIFLSLKLQVAGSASFPQAPVPGRFSACLSHTVRQKEGGFPPITNILSRMCHTSNHNALHASLLLLQKAHSLMHTAVEYASL